MNPYAGNELWSRQESVRDEHIGLFNQAVGRLNYRLSQSKVKYRYDETGGIVNANSELDVPVENNRIQNPDDNQTPEHRQNQNHSELWNKRNFIIAVIALIFIILDFAFGDSFLIRLWNHFPTIKEKIAGWFR